MSPSASQATAFGETRLPPEQHEALRAARRLQIIGSIYLTSCVVVVYLVMGSSQAMMVAWVEDVLSLIPPIAFLIASRRAARAPTVNNPYGHHRAVGSAHLAAAVGALVIASSILKDGVTQIRNATRGLQDAEARTYDDSDVHPVIAEVLATARKRPWVSRAGCRVRDEGHVFHAEVFVVPYLAVTAEQCDELAAAVRGLDWKLADVVVSPVMSLPTVART